MAGEPRAQGAGALAQGHHAPHLVHSAAMLYTFAALAGPSSGGRSGMSGMAGGSSGGTQTLHAPTLAFVFVLLLIAYTVRDLDRQAGADGYFRIVGRRFTPTGPALATAGAAGTASAVLSAGSDGAVATVAQPRAAQAAETAATPEAAPGRRPEATRRACHGTAAALSRRGERLPGGDGRHHGFHADHHDVSVHLTDGSTATRNGLVAGHMLLQYELQLLPRLALPRSDLRGGMSLWLIRSPAWLRSGEGSAPAEWTRVGGMTATVVGLNVVGWGMLAAALGGHYHISKTTVFGVGTGALAYTLGMRHAFDADHIAAIDNTTRKLVSEGKRPLSVGFFFSLGHSSVVFALAVLLNFGIRGLDDQVKNGSSRLQYTTNIIGTWVSGFFLFLIAALNVVILVGILKVFREMRSGAYDDEELEDQLNKRGLMNRFFGPLARRIDTPWKMYPIGFLFGLGFDTATEVALLVLAGTAVVGGLPFYAILSLPILFAAGMSLFDTIDGCFMNFAYDWAFAKPIRKVYYNLTITGLSVFVALFIGAIELLGLLAQDTNLNGSFWSFMANFNINTAGFVIVGVFVVTWIIALAVWRFGRIEQKWDTRPAVTTDTPD